MPCDPGVRREYIAWTVVVLLAFAVSFVGARDVRMWCFENVVFAGCLGVALLLSRRAPPSRLASRLLAGFTLLHLIGAHYLYAHVPFGRWLQDVLELQRNPYDRIVHLAFGAVCVIVSRELLLRSGTVAKGRWLSCLSFSLLITASSLYELLEWRAWLLLIRFAPDADILGAQGDIWDSHWDVLLAACGATLGLITLTRAHDHSLAQPSRTPQRQAATTYKLGHEQVAEP